MRKVERTYAKLKAVPMVPSNGCATCALYCLVDNQGYCAAVSLSTRCPHGPSVYVSDVPDLTVMLHRLCVLELPAYETTHACRLRRKELKRWVK